MSSGGSDELIYEAKLSVLNRVDGSAQLSISSRKDLDEGELGIICSITGPIESKARQESPQQSNLEISVMPHIGVASTREKLLEYKLKLVLDRVIDSFEYPRQLIQIVLQILNKPNYEDDTTIGSDDMNDFFSLNDLNGCLISTYLALIDSGISMKSSFLSSCCIINSNNQLTTDFNKNDLINSKSAHLIVYDLRNGKCNNLIYSESIGEFDEQIFFKNVLDKCKKEIENLNTKVIKNCITEKFKNDYIWKA
ncbi:hypothetical protein PACTADRAFT_47862 [Pachysolen tannophilus NRRL Y-2460]|uniref:Exoribonuclease phosphorolytic domain-containing protein n=1 Tax=Pachysolen tannophilus NRRL Y-2460 TaxID=669874 RepID=A0A1E4U218_PACTA|nr:hypothetical protein PACTADRAFT_47862 [Pachysolen tannophilus NRRL Y-2460]